jgi:hypothetical protein
MYKHKNNASQQGNNVLSQRKTNFGMGGWASKKLSYTQHKINNDQA